MIFSYQTKAAEEIRKTIQAWQAFESEGENIRPRFHRLITGPTGTGKTHLCKAICEELEMPYMVVSTPSWIIAGARSEPTLGAIIESLENSSPKVFILDEIDKISGTTSWDSNLRAEVFDFLDGRFPPTLTAALVKEHGEVPDVVTFNYRESLILACGAFQQRQNQKACGFLDQQHPIDIKELQKDIPPELANRFHCDLIALPNLSKQDYEDMIGLVASGLDESIRGRFLGIAQARMEAAAEAGLGARMIENALASVLIG